MLGKNNNHLFISASVSLILIAFFIVLAKDKTDILLLPSEPEVEKDTLACTDLLTNGLYLQIKDTEATIDAMNSPNTTLENIFEYDSLLALKNAKKCLGRSPLEINIDQFAKGISVENDPIANLKIINKVSALLKTTFGASTAYKNINLNIVTNINLNADNHET